MKQSNQRNGALHLAPLAGRGRIASAIRVRGSIRDCADNRFKNAGQIMQNVIVPESQDAIVVVSEPFVANCVAPAIRVLSAVNLDNKAGVATDEVDGIRPNRLLPDKLVSIQSPGAKIVPQRLLRARLTASHTSRPIGLGIVCTAHAESPPHPSRSARRPLPASGERRKHST
jgi:hypothetical protein